ncbi:NusA family KH domain protein [Methanohalobium evestigatum Z-7303]|uniref:Probable transcription termination protein NusA n=1 Tax=Methanohalobium evestigatum (strain ATCC BAA-1072 / DSM 3721 / NBRC 107634 / OCM 161 / Z-7303) TaxID=644295 RepID=D7E754_METEZ|nr:NusA-like transcription termination signal-binding factor [Methanohalobium evestigatum]ADI73678.1 NusA family KH domain protein [Methanohalobium evestigatum Z-7303]
MSEIKLSTEELRYIAMFEQTTGAEVRDCIVDEDRIIYVVEAGNMGAAIGKNGEHINKVKENVDKHVELVEYSEDPSEFIKNAFGPVAVSSVNLVNKDDKQYAYVQVSNNSKGLAIGSNGKNIDKVKMIANRHHNIDSVIIQ